MLHARVLLLRLYVFIAKHIVAQQHHVGLSSSLSTNQTFRTFYTKSSTTRLPAVRTTPATPPPLPPVPPRRRRKLLVFISYKWGIDTEGRDNGARVRQFSEILAKHVGVWIDVRSMEHNHITQSMCRGIDCCDITLICITRSYIEDCANPNIQSNCRLELDYSHVRDHTNQRVLPIVMESGCLDTRTWSGPVGAYLATKKYIDMVRSDIDDDHVLTVVNSITRICADGYR
jgi:hypothetical protein